MADFPEEDDNALGDVGDAVSYKVGQLFPRPEFGHMVDLNLDTETRQIFVSYDIEEDFGGWITKVFRHLLKRSREPIVVWLNTAGGDTTSMMVFHDLVRACPAEVTIIGHGQICSAGVLMLACGHRRLVSETCVLMSHESRDEDAPGLRHSESKDRRKWADWMHEHWFELMARYTRPHNPESNVAFWRRVTERKSEYWILGGQDIVNHGIADEVYSHEGQMPEPARSGNNDEQGEE